MPITVTFVEEGQPTWVRIEPDANGNLFITDSSRDKVLTFPDNVAALLCFEGWIAEILDTLEETP